MSTSYTIKPGDWLTDRECCEFYGKWSLLGHIPYWRERFELAGLLAIGTGLRVSEMLEIYLEPTEGKSYCQVVEGPEGLEASIYLFNTKGKGGGKKGRIAPKRSRLAQVIPELAPAFKRRYDRRLRDGEKLLFSRPDGLPYKALTFNDSTNGQGWWYQVMRECGIDRGRVTGRNGASKLDRPSIHAGRHTYATWELASRRLNEVELAAQLGNSPDTVRMVYAHAIVEMLYRKNKTPEWREVASALIGQGKLRAVG